ncbi:unnamed protein product [Colletotrichum noveboracense]|uniref:Uncharacterized protein n=1 Tax=Colletotrichum noveboracense TaxID=2664923 RepID=A0A9W4S253_9PEZI|nr:unnamed protein product [Colletotrichum noveboracense]
MAGDNDLPAQGQQSRPPTTAQPTMQAKGSEQVQQQDQVKMRGGCIDKQGFCCGVWPADGCYCSFM